MDELQNLKKKRLYAIVIMIIIMLLVLLLMITTISLEFTQWSSSGGSHHHHHKPEDKPEDVLFTIVTSDDINLYVDAKDVTKESLGELEYKDINSDDVKAKIALRSKNNSVECKYDVIFKIKENEFTNQLGTGNLENQLILKLDGYKSNTTNETEVYSIDLNKLDNNEYSIKDIIIKNNANQQYFIEHNWNAILAFRNYRDYNQNENAGKKITGELEFKVTGCELIK